MKVLVDANRLGLRIAELGAQITRDYEGREIDVVCLINGASMFCADLVRSIARPVRVHALAFTSYAGGPQSGEVRVTLDVAEPLMGRHVLLVEGVVVSGRTPLYLMEALKLRRPASLALCALGVKPKARAVEIEVAYSGFEFGADVAAGYGMGSGPERALAQIVAAAAH
jgi:hypoxanthine phosphoribosyltransferase